MCYYYLSNDDPNAIYLSNLLEVYLNNSTNSLNIYCQIGSIYDVHDKWVLVKIYNDQIEELLLTLDKGLRDQVLKKIFNKFLEKINIRVYDATYHKNHVHLKISERSRCIIS